MNLFISWSGELSNQVAQIINKKIPCIIQAVTPFVSTVDIEKGENWNTRISTELADAKFGIVCLTQENVSAPWVNFEAGAISKTLDSRVSALLIGIQPSDIQGPLRTFQATKLEKQDFLLLLKSINNVLDTPVRAELLRDSFEAFWPIIESEINGAINSKTEMKKPTQKMENVNNAALEEILSLVRRQTSILSNPEVLLPSKYLEQIIRLPDVTLNSQRVFQTKLIHEVIRWIENVINVFKEISLDPVDKISLFDSLQFKTILGFIERYVHTDRALAPNRVADIMYSLKKLTDELELMCYLGETKGENKLA